MIAKISEEGNTLSSAFEYFKFYYEEWIFFKDTNKRWLKFLENHKAVEIFKISDWNCTWRWNFWMISIGIPIEMLYGMANWEQKFVLKSEIRSTHVRDSVCAQALKCHFYWHLSLLTAISTDFCTTMALHLILKNWQRTLYGM